MTPREFGHEGNSRLFDPVLDPGRVFHAQVHAAGAIDRLARLAGSQDGQGTIPLGGRDKDDVHVFAPGKHAEAIDRRGAELDRHLMRSMRHLIANRSQLEPIGEHPQGWSMAMMPEITQPNQTHAKFHKSSGAIRSEEKHGRKRGWQ